MKKPFTRREIALTIATVVCLIFAVSMGSYAASLHAKNKRNDTVAKANGVLLQEKDMQTNKTANYVEAVCAEYRKLYSAYSDLRSQQPSAGAGYALPGSAKGEVDECYRPE